MKDLYIARKYISKVDACKTEGIEFSLSLMSFSNLMRAKKCYYTGLPLNNTTRTVDRVDRGKGYIKGNVVACHNTFNCLKSLIENPNNPLDPKTSMAGLRRWEKHDTY